MTTLNEWLETLESGKYEQGTGVLRFDNEFCCLGVAADILGATWTRAHEDTSYSAFLGETFVGSLVLRHLPKDDELGAYLNNEVVQECLSAMNDSGFSFKEIATHVRLGLYPALVGRAGSLYDYYNKARVPTYDY